MRLPEPVLHDLRYGVRMLIRNAGSTAVMIVALAVGIGVNTAAFTAYKAMVARPLDARDSAEMVNVALTRDSGATDTTFSYPDYQAYRDSVDSFSGLIAFRVARVTLSNAGGMISQRTSGRESAMGRWMLPSGASNAEIVHAFVVSENYFKVLGVAAIQGRTFESMGIAELVAAPAVLISENYWRRRFAGDPALLGKTIHLNGLAVTVVGITPRDFVGTNVAAPAFWIPVSIEPLLQADDQWLSRRETRLYRLFGRLAPGASIGQAQAEMSLAADHLRALHDPQSDSAKPASALVWPGSPFALPVKMYGGLQLAILLIMTASGMVLAVACANVGSLQLARARSRQSELRMRLSLGATRRRIIRQLLTENALLGLLSGVLALLFTWALLKVGVLLLAEAFPMDFGTFIFDVTPDLGIFAFVLGVSLVAGILSQLAPAMESSRWALSSVTRGGTSPARSRRLQGLLLAAQVALSLVLMISGSMLLRSAIRSLEIDTGYDSKRVVALNIQFPVAPTHTAARKVALFQELLARLSAMPGVAATTSARPPGVFGPRTAAVTLDGQESLPTGEAAAPRNVQTTLHYTHVQANYFETLAIPLPLGRSFGQLDDQTDQSVVVSESAAQQLWPGQNPIGRSLHLGPTDEQFRNGNELVADGPAYQVIGVARDTRGVELDGSDSRKIYLPLPESWLLGRPLLIRTESDPLQVTRAFDALILSIDPDLMATYATLEEMLCQSPRFISSSLGAAIASTLGLFGLFLALLGIYGTVSYIVVLRTREVGIRMAIGAQKRHILGLILRESTRPVFAGLLVGMLLAAGATHLLGGLLHGLVAVDGVSFVGVSVMFLVIALLAAYPPARRAMRVDPMVALRYE